MTADLSLDERIRGLRSGAVDPKVTGRWYLPGQPNPDDPDQELKGWAAARGFLERAPRLVGEFLVALQAAIDANDPTQVRLVLVESAAYLGALRDVISPEISREHQQQGFRQLFTYRDGMKNVRHVDPVHMRMLLLETDALILRARREIAHMSRVAWLRGVPQPAADEAPPSLPPQPLVDFVAEFMALADEVELRLDGLHAGALLDVPRDIDEEFDYRLRGADRQRLVHADIDDRDILYEWLAHRYAYDSTRAGLNSALTQNGYSSKKLDFDDGSGASFVVVMPEDKDGDLPPLFVFRGTQLSDLRDLHTDLEFQIGQAHFDSVRSLGLEEMLKGAAFDCCGRRPHVTGHSLGGALAQLAAAHWPELIDEVVTFQAPGLSRANVRLAEERKRTLHRSPPVRHYIADIDLVHRAGQRHLDGETILVSAVHFDRGAGREWGLWHTDLLLTDHRMGSKLDGLQLAAMWAPHSLHGFASMTHHPSATGSGLEFARAGISLSVEFSKAMLKGPRDPLTVARLTRTLVAKGLAQEEPSLLRGGVEVTGIVAGALGRAALRRRKALLRRS